MILIIFLYAVLAMTFVLAKKAVTYSTPCFLIAFRMIIAGVILLLYQYFLSKKSFVIARADRSLFFKTALFHIYFAFMLEFWALQYVTAIKSTLIFTTTPFISAILAYFLFRQTFTLKKIIGVALGLVGVIPTVLFQAYGDNVAGGLWHVSFPDLGLFLAVISGAYAWFLVKQLIDRGYGLGMINGVAMLIGGILSLATSLTLENICSAVTNWYLFLGWTLLLILFANIIFYNLFGLLLKRYTVTFLTFSGFLSPCFGTLYEWAFFGGQISWHHLVSLISIFLGLYVFYQDELREKDEPSILGGA